MQLLEVELESSKAQGERKVLLALKLADEEEKACTYTELLKTGLSRPTLASRLDDLQEKGLITRTPVLKENEWPPQVYYRLTQKGREEFLRRQITAYVANSDQLEKNDRDQSIIALLEKKLLERNLPQRRSPKDLLRDRRGSNRPFAPLAFLQGKDEIKKKALVNAWILAQCLDVFVYGEESIVEDKQLWGKVIEWLYGTFDDYVDKPEEIKDYAIAIMFDGRRARELKDKSDELLADKDLSEYPQHLRELSQGSISIDQRVTFEKGHSATIRLNLGLKDEEIE